MDMKLELVVLPVSDVDRAKAFYEQAGFTVDVDHRAGEEFRVVQLTPPGSACSIAIGKGLTQRSAPGSVEGLQMVVEDIEAARAALVEGGAQPGLDARRVAQRAVPVAARPQLARHLVGVVVLLDQVVHLRLGHGLDDGDEVVDSVGVDRHAEAQFRLDLVAVGHGDVAHVVAETGQPQRSHR